MNDKQILKKAVEKATKNGWLPLFSIREVFDSWWEDNRSFNNYYKLIFNKEFAKAFWKDTESEGYFNYCNTHGYLNFIPRLKDSDGYCPSCGKAVTGKEKFDNDSWIDHIQQMAVAENRLKYIEQYL